MPKRDSEYDRQFKIPEIIRQVKFYGITHSFQTVSPYFPGGPLARFSAPNQTMQTQQSLEESQHTIFQEVLQTI